MRVLLDECVPIHLARALTGHDVRTVARMRWSGLKNGALLRRAATEFDVFLILDRSIEHQQHIPDGLAIVFLRVASNRVAPVLAQAPAVLQALESLKSGHMTTVGD